jgi:sugar O-acyltransferase (sialic acid O-acetyltransferase NeuD family)
MTGLAVLGGGGHGRVVADCALECGWTQVTIFDDDPSRSRPGPWPISGTGRDLLNTLARFDGVIVGIGANPVRLEWHHQLVRAGARAVTLVHPKAFVSRYAEMGAGTVVMAGGAVNIGAILGEGVIVNTGATVDHDCLLGDGAHISPGANLAGGVRVGQRAWVGIGVVVREGVSIGDDAILGAGGVVIRDIASGVTVVGNPSRILPRPET